MKYSNKTFGINRKAFWSSLEPERENLKQSDHTLAPVRLRLHASQSGPNLKRSFFSDEWKESSIAIALADSQFQTDRDRY